MERSRGTLIVLLVAILAVGSAGVALAKSVLPTTADVHSEAGIPCEGCHGDGEPGEVSMDVCLGCHGTYQDLAEATAGAGMNPHESHYLDPECSLCHRGHAANEDFCAGCHAPTTTADMHIAVGVGCSACHGKDSSKRGPVSMDTCLACHGPYEDLAEKTSTLELNPHMSHYPYLDCNECHHGHTTDTDFCAQCH